MKVIPLLKESVGVVEMELTNSSKKMRLPNGKVVDILSPVFEEICDWLQDSSDKAEAGGFIVGYQHFGTENITLEHVSHPYTLDVRRRTFFGMRDPRHKVFLDKHKMQKSFYMGVWHTHPQIIPEASAIDWNDWYATLEVDETGCEYIFFIIAGIQEIRVWVGDFQFKTIKEIHECEKVGGLYKT